MYNAPEMQTRTLRYPALTRIREAIPSTEPPAEIAAAIVRAVRGNGPPQRDSRVPPLGLVPNRLGSRPGTGCGEAILIAFTQVSQPEEGGCRSRRERSSLPDIGSNRSASWAPVGVERDVRTRHPLSRLLRPVGAGADQISLSSARGCQPRRGRLLSLLRQGVSLT